MRIVVLAITFVLCEGAVIAQGILGASGWRGSIRVTANQTGAGNSSIAGFSILENFTHDSRADLLVSLAKDPGNSRRWTGTAQGSVSINNKNVMTMTSPLSLVTCTGTLFWIGNQPQFSGQATLEADATGLSYRLWITPNTIPAPNSGSVVCPYAFAQFPTVDPNSPFVPRLDTVSQYFPVSGTGTQLTGGLPYIGDSGIGGFVASPARITYHVNWDLTAIGLTPPDPPEDPDCESGGSIIGCLDQTLGETIPVTGTPYILRYRSDRVSGYRDSPGQAASLGLGGWWLEPVQLYVPSKRTLLAGDGSSRLLAQNPAPDSGGLISVSDGSGTLNYILNSAGRHLRTTNSRSGHTELTIDYDAQGRISRLTDSAGGATSIERDSNGRPIAIIAPFGQRTTLQTDSNGFLSQVQNPSGEAYSLRHEASGLLSGLTNPAGGNWTFRYNSTGRLVSDSGASGATTTLSRQDSGQNFAVSLLRPGGLTTRYDSAAITGGRRTTTTHPSGGTRSLEATLANSNLTFENGMKVTVTHGRSQLPAGAENSPVAMTVKTPAGLEWSAQWSRQASAAGAPQTEILRVNGVNTTSVYNPSTRTLETLSPAGRKSLVRFNDKGAVIESTAPGGPMFRYEYNQRGQPVAIHEVAGVKTRTAAIEWNAAGRASTVTLPSGMKLGWTYDTSGRLLEESLPGGRVLAYTYDKSGNLASITPPDKPAHNFTYSADGRLLAYSVPADGEPRSTTYSYDNADRITRISNSGSWTLDYSYDFAGRLAQLRSPMGQVDYGYDQKSGNLLSLSGPNGVELKYTWDGGLPLGEEWTGAVAGKVQWRYDHNFLPVARRVNGGEEVAVVYNADGLITGAGAYTLTRESASGNPASFVLNGTAGWWSHDASGNFNASAVSALGNEVYSARYERNESGQIVRKEEYVAGAPTTWEYEYDQGGRLVAASRNGEFYSAYTWDGNDNRTSEQRADGVVSSTFDSGDRILMNGDTAPPPRAVDPWGNLRTAEAAGAAIEYIVDGMARRVGRKVDGALAQAWIYGDSIRPAAELNPEGRVLSEFLYAGAAGPPVAMKRDGKYYLLVADQIGSIRMVIDSESGEVIQQIEYDPFGRVLQDTKPGFQPFGFAGGLYDPATGLVRMGARDYDPALGRWISEDPRPFTGGSNHYAYCGGDPVNLRDPLGTDPTSRAGQVVQTADSKSISDATGTAQKTIDTAGKVVEFAKDPKATLEAEAIKNATPEGAKSEYERKLEDSANQAEQNSTSLRKRLEELYEKARKALCGEEEKLQGDPKRSQTPEPKPFKPPPLQPGKPFVSPIYGPAAGARR